MICSKCGTEVTNEQSFCPNCGNWNGQSTTDNQQQVYNQQPVYNQQQMYNQQPVYNQQQPMYNPQQAFNTQQPFNAVQPGTIEMPMKWHKFLCFFWLWLMALINAFNGYSAMNGLHYGGMADEVYDFFEDLQSIDTTYGYAILFLAAFDVVVAISLIKYKKFAPLLVILAFAAPRVMDIIYVISANNVVSEVAREINIDMSDIFNYSDIVSSVIGTVFMVWCNIVYFGKRKHIYNK